MLSFLYIIAYVGLLSASQICNDSG